jgi:hypothetical protein
MPRRPRPLLEMGRQRLAPGACELGAAAFPLRNKGFISIVDPGLCIDAGQNDNEIYLVLDPEIRSPFPPFAYYIISMDDNSLRTTAFAIEKLDDGWFIALPDKSLLGPYHSGELVLEVAVAHALLARNEGLEAQIYVRDEKGVSHTCIILDYMNDPHRCQKCESAWSTSGLPAKCMLRAAIGGS